MQRCQISGGKPISSPSVHCCVAVWVLWILGREFGKGRTPVECLGTLLLGCGFLNGKYNVNSNKNGMKLLELKKFVTVME